MAAKWLHVDVHQTLDAEAAARHQNEATGRTLYHGGCIADPHIVVHRCLVFRYILH